ncbi:hypothetical protein P170DRAFT_471458 [Aspergillus steynii IBT 23096]|uniref:Uncharacterized protein n=1 Tax=Aspergillus steynii IBT 23096 TaxID=1392250 RepID=A0A2I2GF64_9EURO|nr:uncharacterized protein P170DRAFT_471458 [Aspergillus steynii IBT 23096]PLB51524.1 hypothetical protein P170DRAFT_471458 [Aspergillus steynii IBT 23096]
MASSTNPLLNGDIQSTAPNSPSKASTPRSLENNTTQELQPQPHESPTIWHLFDDEHFPNLLKTILDLSELPNGAFPSDSEDDSEDEDFEPSSDEGSSEFDSEFDLDDDDLDSIPSSSDDLDIDIFGMDARDVAAGIGSRDKGAVAGSGETRV